MANPQFVYHMHKLSKTYPGGKQVLKDINLSFYPGAKIGVVGLNGAGKSTLLKIMAGEIDDFLGEARPADGIKVGYLPQEPELDPEKDVLGNAMEGVAEKKAHPRSLQRDRRQLHRRDRRRDDARCRTRSTRRTCGTSTPRSSRRSMRCAARRATPT